MTARSDAVAEALYRIVVDKGLTQKKLAERTGMKYQALNRTLNGHRPLLARELPILAEACGSTVGEVYALADRLRQEGWR